MSGGEGMPYVGSIISLISMKDCRYVGTLATIDSANASLVLNNVRSFGTEDRPAANKVPPSDQVYSSIIFGANDIKDLTVCDQVPAQDPAAMQVPPGYNPYGYGAPPPGYPGYGAPQGYPGYNPYGVYNAYPPNPYGTAPQTASATAPHVTPATAPSVTDAKVTSNQQQAPVSTGDSSTPTGDAQGPSVKPSGVTESKDSSAPSQSGPSSQKEGASKGAGPAKEAKTTTPSQEGNGGNKPVLPTPKPVPTHQPGSSGRREGSETGKSTATTTTSKSSGGGKVSAASIVQRGMIARGELKQQNKGSGSASAVSQEGGNPTSSAPEPIQGEFDFEKSNALFNKEEFFKLQAAEDGTETPSTGSSGYQKDDFFDSISCEALDRQRERETGQSSRPSLEEQHRKDSDAFGAVAVQNRRNHDRRRGGYRRNYRGRGGRHYHHRGRRWNGRGGGRGGSHRGRGWDH